MKTNGQIAYEGYCGASNGKSLITGKDLPTWTDVKPEIKAAWEASATALLDETKKDVIASAAQLAHEVNRAYCKAIFDDSQKPWEEAEQWQRDSATKGVTHLIQNPSSTPEDQHAAWMKSKLDDGWVYGHVKDPEKKTHPCIVEYAALPNTQRAKDEIFQAAVRTFLRLENFR